MYRSTNETDAKNMNATIKMNNTKGSTNRDELANSKSFWGLAPDGASHVSFHPFGKTSVLWFDENKKLAKWDTLGDWEPCATFFKSAIRNPFIIQLANRSE